MVGGIYQNPLISIKIVLFTRVYVGEDMSFDLKLQSKYDSNIILIDPTTKSVKHYEEIKQYYTIPNFSLQGTFNMIMSK